MNDIERQRAHRRTLRRHRILQATAILPSLATIFNGLSGFGAVHFATKDGFDKASPHNLMIAAGLIFLAMVFDMLDGRLARMTRLTSDFGAQLDSLCDAVSFGLAPAMLVLRALVSILHDPAVYDVFQSINLERGLWCVAGLFMACAILRLARFNVENAPDESAHMSFKGLPSPGAAAAVASLVLLYGQLETGGSLHSLWACVIVAAILTLVTLSTALLMVSRFRYPHLVNQFIRGKRPFTYLVKIVAVVLAVFMWPWYTIAVLTVAFAFSGLVGAIWRRAHATPTAPTAPSPQ